MVLYFPPRNLDIGYSNTSMEDMFMKVVKGVEKIEDYLKELREDIS